jgi:hypothetical protein
MRPVSGCPPKASIMRLASTAGNWRPKSRFSNVMCLRAALTVNHDFFLPVPTYCSAGNTTVAEGIIDIFALSFSGLKRKLALALEEVCKIQSLPTTLCKPPAASVSTARRVCLKRPAASVFDQAIGTLHPQHVPPNKRAHDAAQGSFSECIPCWIEDSEGLIDILNALVPQNPKPRLRIRKN